MLCVQRMMPADLIILNEQVIPRGPLFPGDTSIYHSDDATTHQAQIVK